MKFQKFALALSVALTLSVFTGCSDDDDDNQVPSVTSVTSDDTTPELGEKIILTCAATDGDGDGLTYAWTANGTTIPGTTNSVEYVTPTTAGTVEIVVTVTDGSGSANETLSLDVAEGEFNLLSNLTDAEFASWTAGPVDADSVFAHLSLGDRFIVDLRSTNDFNLGHIEGAHNVPNLAALVDSIESGNVDNDKITLVCYTGQTAAFANMALRMLGYNSESMKFGMAAWAGADVYTDKWTSNCSNAFFVDMVVTESPELGEFGFPELNTGETTAEAILENRVMAVLAEGFSANSISATDLMTALDNGTGNYQVINYWPNNDYIQGHIDGAIQITPGSLTTVTDLLAFDPGKTNALYCYTGQTSALVGFYLNVLGYDMKSMKFGANALFHDDMPGTRWLVGTHTNNHPVIPN